MVFGGTTHAAGNPSLLCARRLRGKPDGSSVDREGNNIQASLRLDKCIPEYPFTGEKDFAAAGSHDGGGSAFEILAQALSLARDFQEALHLDILLEGR